MAWQDSGFLIDSLIDKDGAQHIDVLTRAYGRHRGVVSSSGQVDVSKGSSLDLAHEGLHGSDDGEIQVSNVSDRQLNSEEGSVDLDVVSSIRALCKVLLPIGEPVPDLFGHTIAVVDSLTAKDGRWPIVYARWEVSLLQALGLLDDLDRYRRVLNEGETVYYSPRSNRFFTRSDAGAFLDRLKPVPGFLLGARNAVIGEVKQALDVTGGLIGQLIAGKPGDAQTAEARDQMLRLIDQVNNLPRSAPPKGVVQDERTVKKRLLTLKPLKVSYGGIGKS